MAGRVTAKIVVVTGAGQGQGAVEARALHAEGATVIGVDVRDPVEPVDGISYRRLDVSSADDVVRASPLPCARSSESCTGSSTTPGSRIARRCGT